MIFVMGRLESILFVFLTEQDINDMRGGSTLFLDERQLGHAPFTKIFLSPVPSNESAQEMIRKHGHDTTRLVAAVVPIDGNVADL